jgi:23S rRNA pseudouridine2457 synthase
MPKYILFFKPFEVLSQFMDQAGRRTLKEFVPIPGVYAAGRLDYRSEGLLLLTDDGPLIQFLTDPHTAHTKTYLAQVEGIVDEEALERLNTEIVLPGFQTRLVVARAVPDPNPTERTKPVRNYHPTSWIEITLGEGKKHQVRRMTAAVGYPTLRLIRCAIGNLSLGNMQPGQWRYLSPEEVNDLKLEQAKNYQSRNSKPVKSRWY